MVNITLWCNITTWHRVTQVADVLSSHDVRLLSPQPPAWTHTGMFNAFSDEFTTGAVAPLCVRVPPAGWYWTCSLGMRQEITEIKLQILLSKFRKNSDECNHFHFSIFHLLLTYYSFEVTVVLLIPPYLFDNWSRLLLAQTPPDSLNLLMIWVTIVHQIMVNLPLVTNERVECSKQDFLGAFHNPQSSAASYLS